MGALNIQTTILSLGLTYLYRAPKRINHCTRTATTSTHGMSSTERDPLLQRALHEDAQRQAKADDEHRHRTRRALAACACLTLFVVALVVCLGIWEATADDGGIGIGDGWGVEAVLRRSPVIVRFRCSLLNFLRGMLSLLTISWFCFGTICELGWAYR